MCIISGSSLLLNNMSYADSFYLSSMTDINTQNLTVNELELTTEVTESANIEQEISEPQSLFQLMSEDRNVMEIGEQFKPLWETQEDIQKKLAEEHEKQVLDYSILTNQFYENERIRIFNYTAYNTEQLKNSLLNPTVSSTGTNDFYISFGYGMEFKVNRFNRIGYEYLSAFPYDRGQIIRIYWARNLKY